MTNYNVADLILLAKEDRHFTEMLNACIRDRPTDPLDREQLVIPYLEELAEYLEPRIPPKTNRDELKRVISGWIDQKIAQADIALGG